jgi:hypothetical protein
MRAQRLCCRATSLATVVAPLKSKRADQTFYKEMFGIEPIHPGGAGYKTAEPVAPPLAKIGSPHCTEQVGLAARG